MNDLSDDQWLDNLLASPPVLRDNGFTEHTVQSIKAYQWRRTLVLSGAWLIALIIVLATFPWASIQEWLGILDLTGVSLSDASTSLAEPFKLSAIKLGREDLVSALRENLGAAVAITAIVAVFLKNLLLQDS